jgi:hypothetical protein
MLKVAQVLAISVIACLTALPSTASEDTQLNIMPATFASILMDEKSLKGTITGDTNSNELVWYVDFEQAAQDIKRQLKSEIKPLQNLEQYRNDIILLHKYRFRHVAGINQMQTSAPMSESIAD